MKIPEKEINSPPKKRGRPVGATTKIVDNVVKEKSTLREFETLRHWDTYIYVVFPGSKEEFKIRETVWIMAVLKFGFKAKNINTWPFFEPINNWLNIDFGE